MVVDSHFCFSIYLVGAGRGRAGGAKRPDVPTCARTCPSASADARARAKTTQRTSRWPTRPAYHPHAKQTTATGPRPLLFPSPSHRRRLRPRPVRPPHHHRSRQADPPTHHRPGRHQPRLNQGHNPRTCRTMAHARGAAPAAANSSRTARQQSAAAAGRRGRTARC
jgi:hypothetical protein